MMLIVLLGLIANLVFASDGCDVGKHLERNFDFYRITGTWYMAYHSPNPADDNADCVVGTIATPEGNISSVTTEAYIKSTQTTVTVYGNATNWDRSGFDVIYPPPIIWSGRFNIIAIDYDLYLIAKLCSFQTNEVYVYVGFRSKHPDEATVKKVEKELRKINIELSQLVEMRTDNCQQ